MTLRTTAGTLRTGHRGFTLIEVLVVITIIAILIAILVPSLGAARSYARKAKDSTHIRAIAQGMGVWAANNGGALPLPSAIDLSDATVRLDANEAPIVKNNTGNVLSVLIYNGVVEPVQAVAPQETNDLIEVDTAYERGSAGRAEVPENALWDPGFAGFPGEQNSFSGVSSNGRRSQTIGNTSYGLAMPFGDRLPMWTASFDSRSVLAGNRGPRYQGEPGAWELRPNAQGTGSKTLGFYGPGNVWQGHLGFGDGHVGFFTEPDPENVKIVFGENGPEGSFGDNVFINEHDSLGRARPEDQDRPGRWKNAYIRQYGNVQADVGDIGDPRVALFFD